MTWASAARANLTRCPAPRTISPLANRKSEMISSRIPSKTISARIQLRCLNLVDRAGYLTDADQAIVTQLRETFKLVGGPAALAAAGADPASATARP